MTIPDKLEKIADWMNEMLEADPMDNDRLEQICQFIIDQTKVRFNLLDFEFFTEERLAILKAERPNVFRDRDHSAICKQEDLEKNCQKHIRFKKYFRIEKSMFYSDENILIYFHTGTAKNDLTIYSRLTLPKTGFFINSNVGYIKPGT